MFVSNGTLAYWIVLGLFLRVLTSENMPSSMMSAKPTRTSA